MKLKGGESSNVTVTVICADGSPVIGKPMTAKIINGNELAQQIREELKKEVAAIKAKHNVVPGLVTILVGEDPASLSYVTAKQRTSHDLDFYSIQDNQPSDIAEEKLLKLIGAYNKDRKIHGILVQLPLPKHIDEKKVLNAIDPDKDVDGFHAVNVSDAPSASRTARESPRCLRTDG